MSAAEPPRFQPEATGPVCVAYSGGADSHALLHALAADAASRHRGLRALHVHHGLHHDADAWAAHCHQVCSALDVPLHVERVHVDRSAGDGPEAAARSARRRAFSSNLRDDEFLALAHHRDDQAETFLLRALRGSGPDGLASMRPLAAFANGWIWRPWLQVSRAEIAAFSAGTGGVWLDDPSNADLNLDRNYLRHRVMPLLQDRWAQAPGSFARAAALCDDAAALLDAEDRSALAGALDAHGALHILALERAPAARRARVLRLWVAQHELPPLPASGIAQIETALLTSRADASAEFRWGTAWVRAWGGRLHAGPGDVAPCVPSGPLPWTGTVPLTLADGSTLAFEPAFDLGANVMVRARAGGERITLAGRTHSHSLKNLLQERGVPPWERRCMPLICDGIEVLAAGDCIVSGRLQRALDSNRSVLAWHRRSG